MTAKQQGAALQGEESRRRPSGLDEYLESAAKPREQALHEYLERLDERLQVADAASDRRSAFVALVEFHGEALAVECRRKAAALGFATAAAGDEAMNKAFLRLLESLDSRWPPERTFLHRFRGQVWNELRHQRAKIVKLRARFPSLDDEEAQLIASDEDLEQRCQRSEQLRRVVACLKRNSRTAKQRRLVRAWMLSKLGFDWAEVQAEIQWQGSCESLRVSVSRFFNRLKPQMHG